MKRNLILLVLILLAFFTRSQDVIFTKVTTGDIVNDGGWNYGMVWADFNDDDLADLFCTNNDGNNGKHNFLYFNNGDGSFTKLTEGEIVNDSEASYACTAADVNGDGFTDLFVANHNENNSLYFSNGDGSFYKVTEGAIVSNGGKSVGASWADYDLDGWLDLYVANRDQTNFLYHGLGYGEFEKISGDPAVMGSDNSSGCAWADYNQDGFPDLYVANSGSVSKLFKNNGDGTFSNVEQDPFIGDVSSCAGCSWGDCDNDGDLDLFVSTGQLGTYNNWFYINNGDETFIKVIDSPLVNAVTWSAGSAWGDYDNDGDLDLMVAGYDGNNLLFQNDGSGVFTDAVSNAFSNDGGYTEGLAWADVDNDGDLDIFTAKNNYFGGNNSFFLNDGNENNWLKIKMENNWPFYNPQAIGAQISVWATINGQQKLQFRELNCQSGGGQAGQNEMIQFFGMGNALMADSVVVKWMEFTFKEENVSVNQTLLMDLQIEAIEDHSSYKLDPLIVFPNPSQHNFSIKIKGAHNYNCLRITGVSGKEYVSFSTKQLSGEGVIIINAHQYQMVAGVYVVHLEGYENIFTEKIVLLE